jgi:hypothetical protein
LPLDEKILTILPTIEFLYIVISEWEDYASYLQATIPIDKITVGKIIAYTEE